MSKIRVTALPVGAVACALVLGIACKRDQPAPSPVRPAFASVATPTARSPMPAAAGDGLAWDLPAGWSKANAGGMRYATLKPPTPGKLDVSVIVLPGPAGGELANVNRWRGQIGLPPIDEAARAQARKQVDAKAGPVSLYEFAGAGQDRQRMLVGLLMVGGRSWFIKMVGDDVAVSATRADFVKLLESLRSGA